MGYWGRAVTGLALMLGAVAAVAFSISAAAPLFLLGGWIFAGRGRMHGVNPGLPPVGGDPLSNPRIGRS